MSETRTIIQELADMASDILERGQVAKETMDEISEWDTPEDIIKNVTTVFAFLGYATKAIAMAAEKIVDTVSNEDKLDATVELFDSYIDLPGFLETIDGPVLKLIISAAYQFIVKEVRE